MTLRAYKYRFYPNADQARMLNQTFGCTRFVYNNALAYSKEQYELGNKTNFNDWSKNLTILKKNPDFVWLKDVASVPLQQSLKHLDKAFKSFFKSGFGYPKFKNKRGKQSACYVGTAFRFNRDKCEIELAKMKQPLKIKWSRSFVGIPSSVYVSKTKTGKYFISILVEEEIIQNKPTDKTVGIDLGIKSLAVCSDGVTFDNPKSTAKYAKKLAKEQRKLSKKKKGSSNFSKQRIKVAKIHEKIANVRMDFTHKMTTRLINENQVIGIESLKVKNMIKNKKLSKALSDANFGEIVRQLEYKANWYGRTVSAISQWFPSSKMCSACGCLFSGKWSLGIREWTCDCGSLNDRDINAAINIHAEGLRLIA
ncbi:RNA-guided endonuclease TnpB family protein [Photobacterium damselae]|uniref:Peyer's patch-specific virulence factor GipA (Transposase) n=2 Tax=Photobacterium damselae TaxID=38293 RepID=D0Z591_PHODD|nr:RNA-guided endonuclease TnpB family protein [Photobacterium damselae]EEZ39125.1 peyer's patch-specific virulence factor GipA (transposase) [Photobacterium damselae subsp. damselae CIP 102761]PSW76668.1 transposase [Photobacterium damselae]SPY46086.1 transposase, IS605 OrfB family [Photobacterium damselae]